MFSIAGKLDKAGNLESGWNVDQLVSFKVGEDPKEKTLTLALNFSDGTKELLVGDEAKTFYEKLLCKNLQVSINAVQIGGANKMLAAMQANHGAARVKAEKEAKEKVPVKSPFRRSI